MRPVICSLLLMLTIVFATNRVAMAQADSTWMPSDRGYGLMPKKEPVGWKSIQVNGFYRFFGTYQRQLTPYLLNAAIGDTTQQRSLFIGDDEQLPNLLLNISGRTSDRSSWGFDLMMFQFLNGIIGTTYGRQVADSLRPTAQNPRAGARLGGNLGMLLGMNLYGNFQTGIGTIDIRVGGIQWYSLSDFTMAAWRGYNRFMLFDRNPWDPMGRGISQRYDQYFEQGSISQDMRWGNRAFQGAIIEGNRFPHKMSFALLAGKTELNGGFSPIPNFAFGGKIKKDWGERHFLSINSFNQRIATDSLSSRQYGYNILTAEFAHYQKEWSIRGEMGAGRYFSPQHSGTWGEALQLKIATSDKRFAQLEIHGFRISQHVVNNLGVFWNTAVNEYRTNTIPAGQVGSTAVLVPFSSSMVRLGQMTNNRQGLNINIQTSRGKLRVSGGIGFSAELVPAAPTITHGNPVNALVHSRFWRWAYPTNVGPYNRYADIYRDVYQTVNLSDDSSGIVVNKKYFNTMEAQLKYRQRIGNKELYLFSLLQCNSSSRTWSPVTHLDERAYIRQYVAEFEGYYPLSKTILINGYMGFERTLGNYLTDIDNETRRPRNQTGRGFGAGIDVDMGRNVRLYLRHRWFYFKDQSFSLDHFHGRELSVELKALF